MKLKVKSLRYEDLTEEDKQGVSDNGCGKEYAGYLEVLHDEKRIILESDGMQPEDATFCRDLNWILSLLSKVYTLGVIDGQEEKQ